MSLSEFDLDFTEVEGIIRKALLEDLGSGDITTNSLIALNQNAKAVFISKDSGVVAGLDVARRVFELLDSNLTWISKKTDGDTVIAGDIIAEFSGTYRAILSGERTALNFLQRMSGIASKTARCVDEIKKYKTKILDTRKTVPGLRMLDKYAVKIGGGMNHRIGLFDMAMLKENHIRVAGGISLAVKQVKNNVKNNIKIEVETTKLSEVKEALEAGADIIMLDNMTNEEMKKAVEIIAGRSKVEASGSMNLERLKEVAELGVDFISIGSLTHSVEAFDISQQVIH